MRALAWVCLAGSTVLALSYSPEASARPFRVNDIPNGSRFGCLNCHLDMSGMSFTPFGSDARSHLVGTGTTDTKHVSWDAGLCNRDSDGDTYSNGVELGDPGCTWVAGQPDPGGRVTNPGDPSSYPPPVCGNGKLDPGEDCEGTQLSSTMCSDIGMGTGVLACTSTCKFDTSACSLHHVGAGGGQGSGDGSSSGGCAVSPADAGPSNGAVWSGLVALTLASLVTARRTRPRL